MKKDRLISLRLDEATYQRLKSLADHSGVSLSTVIRRHLEPAPGGTFTFGSGSVTVSSSSPWLTTWNGAAA